MTAAPVTRDELQAALTSLGLEPGMRAAVAVSGGADSLCLALLAHDILDIACLTVDHGLRPESADEARAVGDMLAGHGIRHTILTWQGDKPAANIQAEARIARYRLMADWCAANGIERLLTAHHRDDQAETLLLRLARGSGVYGLAAMAPTGRLPGTEGGLRLVRPFLDFTKARLVATLESRGIRWIEDPSNLSMAFDRVKVRSLLASPPLEGLTADRLADTAKRLRRTRDALEYYEKLWLRDAVRLRPEGHVFINPDLLDAAPEEIVLRGLSSLVRMLGGGAYVPRLEKMERLLGAMLDPGFAGQTLDGVQFVPQSSGSIVAVRELRAIGPAVPLEGLSVWDNRFDIWAEGDIAGRTIGALGETGWKRLVADWPEARKCGLPHAVRLSLPALYHDGRLQAVPHLGYSVSDKVTLRLTARWPALSKK